MRKRDLALSAHPAPGEPNVCVLLVDDEAMIRMVLEDVLVDAGHKVQAAADAHEAIQHLDAQPDRFSAIVTDLHMPGPLKGTDLIEYARSKHPTLPIVLSTGLSGALRPNWATDYRVEVLDKPYALDTLVLTLARLLG